MSLGGAPFRERPSGLFFRSNYFFGTSPRSLSQRSIGIFNFLFPTPSPPVFSLSTVLGPVCCLTCLSPLFFQRRTPGFLPHRFPDRTPLTKSALPESPFFRRYRPLPFLQKLSFFLPRKCRFLPASGFLGQGLFPSSLFMPDS